MPPFWRLTWWVLIATVVEQRGLDLDFGWMITDLAPIDLLISAPVACNAISAMPMGNENLRFRMNASRSIAYSGPRSS